MNQSDETPITNSAATTAERHRLALRWIRAAERLGRTPNKRVRQAMATGPLYYIREFGGLGEPIVSPEHGWGLMRWEMPDNGFLLVPLIKSDAKLHQFFLNHMASPNYQGHSRAIFLPPDKISSTWRAILLYHEVGHFVFHRGDIYRDKEMGHWMEEYEIYVKEAQLVRNMYGKPYILLVRKLTKLYETELNVGKLQINDKKALPRDELEKIFGRAQSALERGVQRSVTVLDALYRALDRLHLDGDKSEHYRVTEWFATAKPNENL